MLIEEPLVKLASPVSRNIQHDSTGLDYNCELLDVLKAQLFRHGHVDDLDHTCTYVGHHFAHSEHWVAIIPADFHII